MLAQISNAQIPPRSLAAGTSTNTHFMHEFDAFASHELG